MPTIIKTFPRPGGILEITTGDGANRKRFIPHGKKGEPEGPGIVRAAANFGRAVAKHVATGAHHATASQILERYEICANCPSGMFQEMPRDKRNFRIKEVEGVGKCLDMGCGCFLHREDKQPNKLAMASQSCPQNHWGPVENA